MLNTYINLINLDFLRRWWYWWSTSHLITARITNRAICTFLLYASMGPRYVNIMVFTEDLWFLSGMTTVLLQKTWQVWNCLLGTMPCASQSKEPGCVPDVPIEVSRAAWSKHWRQCVWLTCPTRATLASRCSRRTAQKLPRCGAGARAKSTCCDLPSFRPALFEIWWPDIYLGERSNVLARTGPAVWKVRRASAYVEGWQVYSYVTYGSPSIHVELLQTIQLAL